MKIAILAVTIFCFFAGRGYAAANDEQTYGPVQAEETLFRIALKHQQTGITVSQLMMAIYQHNPDAFARRNINRLKAGAILKIPSAATIVALGRRQAIDEANAQIEAYQRELGEVKVGRGEMAPLGRLPRNPDLIPESAINTLDSVQVAQIDQQLSNQQRQTAPLDLPEPIAKPPRKRRQAPSLFRYSYDISIADDDNLRLAQDNDDIRSDLVFSPTIKAKAGKSLDSFTILNYGGSLGFNQFETFGELDNFEFDVNVKYRFALSSGFSAPIFSLGAKLGGVEFESEMRDSTLLSLTAELNRWLTNKVNLSAGLGFKARESKSEVYDTSEARLFVNFDIDLSKSDLVYTTLTYISGDTVSSATPSLGIINAADAIEPDDAFGGIDANQFAYRIDATTAVVTLGYNRIVKRGMSVDLSARFVRSEAKDDNDIYYERTILRASLLGRF